jgi:predicted  nucleic acid-binding Zn-ribbon protein
MASQDVYKLDDTKKKLEDERKSITADLAKLNQERADINAERKPKVDRLEVIAADLKRMQKDAETLEEKVRGVGEQPNKAIEVCSPCPM